MARDPRGIEAQLRQVAMALGRLEERAEADHRRYLVGTPGLRRLVGNRHKMPSEKLAEAVAEWHRTLRWLANRERREKPLTAA